MKLTNLICWVALSCALAAGCRGASLEGKTACRDQSDCLSGYACIDELCVATSEGCDAFCANACAMVSSCGLGDDPRCADDCVAELGRADCGRLEPFDRLSCGRIEQALECAGYCQALCERAAECATIDADLCTLGCVEEQPQICNPRSVPVRTCEQIKTEGRLYDNAGRAIVEGGDFAFGYSVEAFGLCWNARECEAPLACSIETSTCAPCTSDAECDGTLGRTACLPEGCVSVECVDDDDCSSGVCDTTVHECRECREDADCFSGGCDVETQMCVGCVTDEHCDPRLLPACDTELKTCVPCTKDEHCEQGVLGAGVLLACDVERQLCTECTADRHCTDPSEPACDTESTFCVQCTRNEHCKDPLGSRCEGGFCGECFSDEDCAHLDGAPHCSVLYGVCGECGEPEHCLDPARPQCEPVNATCVP